MFTIILTLCLCLSRGDEITYFKQSSMVSNSSDQPPYDIYDWSEQLHLETCALVAIGLKYFAIFVEDVIKVENGTLTSTKYFLGVCHQFTLEEWTFCSPNLAKKRKHKCRFKLKGGKYHARVHRRFCDIRIMVNNKDCQCQPTIFGDEMYKVGGFPTCYVSPLPSTLCKYNVCGLASCSAFLVENTIHTVECDQGCTGGNPFCEYPIKSSSRVVRVGSSWKRWKNLSESDSSRTRSIATCTNNSTGKGDLDCLGPGTACCSTAVESCTCSTFEKNGILYLERIMIQNKTEISPASPKHSRRKPIDIFRRSRDTDDDIEDDDAEDEDMNEDIVLEENTDDQVETTSEELDRDEMLEEFRKDSDRELDRVGKNNTLNAHSKNAVRSCAYRNSRSMLLVVILLVLNKY